MSTKTDVEPPRPQHAALDSGGRSGPDIATSEQPLETEGPVSGVRSKPARGFAAMDAERQKAIASKGGRAAHEKGTAHEFTREEARSAGKKGGEVISGDREHMASIGRKGGEAVSRNREHMASIGRKGGEAVSHDRKHMSAIGRRGGESRGEQRARVRKTEAPAPPSRPDDLERAVARHEVSSSPGSSTPGASTPELREPHRKAS